MNCTYTHVYIHILFWIGLRLDTEAGRGKMDHHIYIRDMQAIIWLSLCDSIAGIIVETRLALERTWLRQGIFGVVIPCEDPNRFPVWLPQPSI